MADKEMKQAARQAARKNVSAPMIGRYNSVAKYLLEVGLGVNCILQPQMTRRTMELGSQHSPDFVCTPFKSTLGSMIEALEAGADTLVMMMGLCRLGYYGELQEQILRDLGYHFEMINLAEYDTGKKKDYLKALKRFNPDARIGWFAARGLEGLKMIEYIDEIEATYYKNCGFYTGAGPAGGGAGAGGAGAGGACSGDRGAYRRVLDQFIASMYAATCRQDIEAGYRQAKAGFAGLPVEKPSHPLRVGIVGEYFTVMDGFSNLDLEQKLADLGVEVHRWMRVSNRNLHYAGEKNLNIRIRDLCTYEMGPTSTANIWCARDYAEAGFDGIIHVKSAGCTPEIDIMPVLQNIGAQYKIPILYLTYDTQTSDTGLMTRLEAFYDMIAMRKRGI